MRDLLDFWTWQRQKQSKPVQSWRPRANAFYAPATKKWARSNEVLAAPVTQNHLSKPEDLMIWCSKMQPLLGNQRPDLLTRLTHVPLVLFKCPTLANAFETATNPSRFAHFWRGAESLAPATRNDIWTSKSAPTYCVRTRHNGLDMCFVHNGVHFFISHLPRWLRARRFSEPILFDPPEPQNIGKTQCFCDLSTFSRACVFFLLTLSVFRFLFSDLLSSFFFLILFSSLLWLFPPLLFDLSILSEVWLLNFLW